VAFVRALRPIGPGGRRTSGTQVDLWGAGCLQWIGLRTVTQACVFAQIVGAGCSGGAPVVPEEGSSRSASGRPSITGTSDLSGVS
jgi:hypothetical protein